jgi:Flp pilus assembly protein TadG
MSRFRRDRERGQSLVEFALVLPIFMLLLFAIVDGGRVVFQNNELAQATRAVARVASTTCFQTTPACTTSSGPILSSIQGQRASALQGATWSVNCINPATNTARTNSGIDVCKVGDRISVTASTPFRFVTPIASSFGPVTVAGKTEQEILQ